MLFNVTAHQLPKVFFLMNFEPNVAKVENKNIFLNLAEYDIDH